MTIELHRSQDLAEKYRNLYELERRKNAKDGEHLPPVEDSTKLPDKETSYTFLGGTTRINDIIRKNEVCYAKKEITIKKPIFFNL